MSNVKRRTIVGRHTVRHRAFEVERIEWKHTNGLSFDVQDVATGALLTQESLDDEPGAVEIGDLLDRLADDLEAGSLDLLFFDKAQLRAILRNCNGTHGVCRFCELEVGPDYHLAGGIRPGENPIVCDQCWDERLR